MHLSARITLTLLAFCGIAQADDPRAPVAWVNPYIATGGSENGPEYGGTAPLVTTPFGMTNWTAQTRQNRISVGSYAYEDDAISGFIGTHQPAIWMGDYGYVTLMPEVGPIQPSVEYRRLRFSRADETVTPYYYAVKMGDANGARRIFAEMTATDHCGYLRFTFPAGTGGGVLVEATRAGVEGWVKVDADHSEIVGYNPDRMDAHLRRVESGTRAGVEGWVKVDADHSEIVGYNPDRMDAHLSSLQLPNFKGYFVARFRRHFHDAVVYQGPLSAPGSEIKGDNVGAFARFDAAAGPVIEVQVGTSFISIEQARANLDAELPAWDFEATKAALEATW